MTTFSKKSMLTGKVNEMDIPITHEEYQEFLDSGEVIQKKFPSLTADQREFLLTGSTPEEWDIAFPEDEEDWLPENEEE